MLWYINYTINTYTRHIHICYYTRSFNLTDVKIQLCYYYLQTIVKHMYVHTCTCDLIHIHFTNTYIYLCDLGIRS